jgi:hypothetical protein
MPKEPIAMSVSDARWRMSVYMPGSMLCSFWRYIFMFFDPKIREGFLVASARSGGLI